MNGTPEKHSFSSSEEKERKTEGGGGAESKMEGKDRMGFGGGQQTWWIYFLTSLKYSDRAKCDKEAARGDASMAES